MASLPVYKKHFGENLFGSHSERFSTVYEHLSDQKGVGGVGLLTTEIYRYIFLVTKMLIDGAGWRNEEWDPK